MGDRMGEIRSLKQIPIYCHLKNMQELLKNIFKYLELEDLVLTNTLTKGTGKANLEQPN